MTQRPHIVHNTETAFINKETAFILKKLRLHSYALYIRAYAVYPMLASPKIQKRRGLSPAARAMSQPPEPSGPPPDPDGPPPPRRSRGLAGTTPTGYACAGQSEPGSFVRSGDFSQTSRSFSLGTSAGARQRQFAARTGARDG